MAGSSIISCFFVEQDISGFFANNRQMKSRSMHVDFYLRANKQKRISLNRINRIDILIENIPFSALSDINRISLPCDINPRGVK